MSESKTAAEMPDSVALSLPEVWDDIPLEESAHRAFVKEQMALLEENSGIGRAELRQLELVAAWSLQVAKAGRVMLASSFFGIESSDSEDVDDTLLTAMLIVSALRREELGTDLPLSAETMVAAFTDNASPEDAAVKYTHVEPPEICQIGDYQAAKLTRLMTARRDLKTEFRQFLQTYLVSCADGDAVIVLQFSTTNFEHAKPFSELFDRIARTLRILYPDDPTFVDG